MNAGPFGIDTRPALTGVKYAESQGKGNAFHAAVLKAYWEQARNIEDRDVLAEIAAAVGLAPEEFRASLDDPAFIRQVDTDIQQAQAYGLQGVPALIFAQKYLVPGAVPYATLVDVTERVQAEDG